jgi:hypothetical protein
MLYIDMPTKPLEAHVKIPKHFKHFYLKNVLSHIRIIGLFKLKLQIILANFSDSRSYQLSFLKEI